MRNGRTEDWLNRLFAALAIGAGGFLWYRDGAEAALERLGVSLTLLLQIAPIVAVALLVSGYAQALVPRRAMERWLGGKSGLRGLTIAAAAGAVTPGGPFAAFPLVIALYQAGAGFAVCVTYITAWSVLGIHRVLVWEIPLLGEELVALRYLVSLPLPLLAGLLAMRLARAYPALERDRGP